MTIVFKVSDNIKEAILLGGEPLLHPNLFELIKKLRQNTNLKFIINALSEIKICPNELFNEYGVYQSQDQRSYHYNIFDDQQGEKRITQGIWQIIKLILEGRQKSSSLFKSTVFNNYYYNVII